MSSLIKQLLPLDGLIEDDDFINIEYDSRPSYLWITYFVAIR